MKQITVEYQINALVKHFNRNHLIIGNIEIRQSDNTVFVYIANTACYMTIYCLFNRDYSRFIKFLQSDY